MAGRAEPDQEASKAQCHAGEALPNERAETHGGEIPNPLLHPLSACLGAPRVALKAGEENPHPQPLESQGPSACEQDWVLVFLLPFGGAASFVAVHRLSLLVVSGGRAAL